MGTWGYKAFENDGAADWLYDLEDLHDAKSFFKPIHAVIRARGKVDIDDALESVAAAEVIAGARYEPPRDLPRIARSWIKRVAFVPRDADIKLAIRAIKKTGAASELGDSWKTEGKLRQWQKEIGKLSERLKKALQSPAPVRQLKVKATRETLAELILSVASDKIGTRRAELHKKLSTIANPNHPVGGKWQGETLNRLTPLHWVASRGMIPEAKILIERGAQIEPNLFLMASPIDFAIENNETEMVGFLLKSGASVTDALYSAITRERLEMIKLIVAHGAKINEKQGGEWTAIHRAAYHGSPKPVELLLSLGANPRCVLESGETPLHMAALGASFDKDTKNIAKFETLTKLLLKKGAQLNALNNEGKTPLDVAEEASADGIAKVLRRHGARSGSAKGG
jgi:ankyrin repeat protein